MAIAQRPPLPDAHTVERPRYGLRQAVLLPSSLREILCGKLLEAIGGARRCRAPLRTAALHLWLPKACHRVFRAGSLGAVLPAVYHSAAFQLCGHRGEAGAARSPCRQRQSEIGDVTCRSRLGAEGAAGTGSAAYLGLGRPGPPLHLWRRSGPWDTALCGASSRTEPGFQSLDAPADDCARAGRNDLAEDPWRSEAFSLLERPSL